uniref:Precorrin-8X methylmutase CbiC/CobH n=1 Tax=Cyanothece sp. (strain PCC 7425 / ATCC 29141) TaxID=395961 RepID=B8HMP9_CYAP4
MVLPLHPILQQSFALIDQEMGEHRFGPEEYQVLRRVIHSTADFDFQDLLYFSPGVISIATTALGQKVPIITDVTMVKQGVLSLVEQTFQNPLVSAIDFCKSALPGRTRTETGLLQAIKTFPTGIYVIGNAPTALLALCDAIRAENYQPTCVIAAPVGFVSVVESKAALAQLKVPQIRVDGRKGGSAVAAAILNALLTLAWNDQ